MCPQSSTMPSSIRPADDILDKATPNMQKYVDIKLVWLSSPMFHYSQFSFFFTLSQSFSNSALKLKGSLLGHICSRRGKHWNHLKWDCLQSPPRFSRRLSGCCVSGLTNICIIHALRNDTLERNHSLKHSAALCTLLRGECCLAQITSAVHLVNPMGKKKDDLDRKLWVGLFAVCVCLFVLKANKDLFKQFCSHSFQGDSSQTSLFAQLKIVALWDQADMSSYHFEPGVWKRLSW